MAERALEILLNGSTDNDSFEEPSWFATDKGPLKMASLDWAQWLTPIIPELWEAHVDRSPEVRSLRPAWPTW